MSVSAIDRIHRWFNKGITKDCQSGSYSFTPTEIKYDNWTIAYKKRNKYFIAHKFFRFGSFGKGYSSYDLIQAGKHRDLYLIEHDYLFDSKLRIECKYAVKEYVKEVLLNKIDNRLEYYIGTLGKINNKVFNNKVTTWHNVKIDKLGLNTDLYDELYTLKLYFPTEKKLINKVYSELFKSKPSGAYWTNEGWGSNPIYYTCKKITYRDTLKLDFENIVVKELSKKHLEEYKFKTWRYNTKYRNLFPYDLKESRRIYNLPEAEREEILLKLKQSIQNKEKLKKIEKHLRKVNKLNKALDSFYNKQVISSDLRLLDYDVIEKVKNKIVTSQRVTIDYDEGVKLYILLFLKYANEIKNNQEVDLSNLNLTIDYYNVRGLFKYPIIDRKVIDEKEVYSQNDVLCLKIGCHNIPVFEIERFVNKYVKTDDVKR